MKVEQGFGVNERVVSVNGMAANVVEYPDAIVFEYEKHGRKVMRSYEPSEDGLRAGLEEWLS